MAATVKVYEYWAAAPSAAAVSSAGARFCTSDTNDPGVLYPMVRPSDGSTNHSYEKHFALYAETSAAGGINNIKWYTDGTTGATWTGLSMFVGTTSAYTQTSGTEGVTGNDSLIATSAAFAYTSGAQMSVGGSIASGATGKISDYVVLQMDITSAAGPGTIAAETITWQYDET